MIDNDNTTTSTSFDRSSTLSSSNSLMFGRQKPSIPPTPSSEDQLHPFLSNPSMSLTSHSEDSNNMRRGDMSQFQQLDEVSAL